ncbi:membrane-spanning 4-domains subfamily A member 14 isoform X2 [Talpa occidentalis]|uniref:membrane-spanning 4-domains subfamily A member 14 isoform X2 n=1 Tax=Talpa occidentalis TaxID=50954 RepID=UPI00188E3328|nr:membrane-spanning 4-domains subfamily A member 14 isoform X2 [Talpa occidentalis]
MESSSRVKKSTHAITVQPNETILTAIPFGPQSSLLEFLKGEPNVLGFILAGHLSANNKMEKCMGRSATAMTVISSLAAVAGIVLTIISYKYQHMYCQLLSPDGICEIGRSLFNGILAVLLIISIVELSISVTIASFKSKCWTRSNEIVFFLPSDFAQDSELSVTDENAVLQFELQEETSSRNDEIINIQPVFFGGYTFYKLRLARSPLICQQTRKKSSNNYYIPSINLLNEQQKNNLSPSKPSEAETGIKSSRSTLLKTLSGSNRKSKEVDDEDLKSGIGQPPETQTQSSKHQSLQHQVVSSHNVQLQAFPRRESSSQFLSAETLSVQKLLSEVSKSQIKKSLSMFSDDKPFQELLFQDKPSQVRPSQDKASQVRPSQDRASQDRPSQVRASQFRASQDRATQDRACQARASQDTTSQSRTSQDTTQGRASQDTTTQGRATQDRACQVRASQDTTSQSRASQDTTQGRGSQDITTQGRTTQDRACQVRASQDTISQSRASQDTISQSRTSQDTTTQSRAFQDRASQDPLYQLQSMPAKAMMIETQDILLADSVQHVEQQSDLKLQKILHDDQEGTHIDYQDIRSEVMLLTQGWKHKAEHHSKKYSKQNALTDKDKDQHHPKRRSLEQQYRGRVSPKKYSADKYVQVEQDLKQPSDEQAKYYLVQSDQSLQEQPPSGEGEEKTKISEEQPPEQEQQPTQEDRYENWPNAEEQAEKQEPPKQPDPDGQAPDKGVQDLQQYQNWIAESWKTTDWKAQELQQKMLQSLNVGTKDWQAEALLEKELLQQKALFEEAQGARIVARQHANQQLQNIPFQYSLYQDKDQQDVPSKRIQKEDTQTRDIRLGDLQFEDTKSDFRCPSGQSSVQTCLSNTDSERNERQNISVSCSSYKDDLPLTSTSCYPKEQSEDSD